MTTLPSIALEAKRPKIFKLIVPSFRDWVFVINFEACTGFWCCTTNLATVVISLEHEKPNFKRERAAKPFGRKKFSMRLVQCEDSFATCVAVY